MSIRLPSQIAHAMAEGRQAYVALDLSSGPHVTPGLYAWTRDRLWMAAASTTVKAKVTDEHPKAASIVVRTPGRDVILSGPLESFDVRRPLDLVRRMRELPGAVSATLRFGLRNAEDLFAFATDTVRGRLGRRIPPARVLLSLDPRRAMLLENDTIVGSVGWDEATDERNSEGAPAGGQRAVAAFPGPLCVPCRWFADERQLWVSPVLVRLLDLAHASQVAIVVDDYNAPGPAAKQGQLLRGDAIPAGPDGCFDVKSSNLVEWDGVKTSRTSSG